MVEGLVKEALGCGRWREKRGAEAPLVKSAKLRLLPILARVLLQLLEPANHGRNECILL